VSLNEEEERYIQGLVGKCEGKGPLGRPKDGVKMDIKVMGLVGCQLD